MDSLNKVWILIHTHTHTDPCKNFQTNLMINVYPSQCKSMNLKLYKSCVNSAYQCRISGYPNSPHQEKNGGNLEKS